MVAEPEVELVAPKAAAGQVISGREYVDPIHVGPGDVASAPSDLACTTGKDTGYYSPFCLFAFQMHMRMRIFQGGSIGPPFKWYNAILHKECRAIAI